MQVISTSALPIDLAGQVTAAVPGTVVQIPASGHVGIADLDLHDADALVCLLLDRIDAAVFARAPKLRVVANCAVGIDNIDLEAATAAGVYVTNTPDVLTEATAELAFTLLLACARRLGEGERLVRSGTWTGWALDQLLGVGLLGKTLGIIGMGRIGQAMARRALGFGMHVIYADPHQRAWESNTHAGASIAEGWEGPVPSGPREATGGGVNGPALPDLKGEEVGGLEEEFQPGTGPSAAGLREATRGGVNGPALPDLKGEELGGLEEEFQPGTGPSAAG
ncbi:MAG TPA: NAD(P)-dependent oxidoreductase, partial [Kofleriaceae bacterium]|nr:NAD(P)-dependent oxidoreductase [Kofleriaceae bacterium]